MTHLRGCADRREAVAALVMGVLPTEEAVQLEAHLACCEECRRLHESLRRQEADLLWGFERLGSGARSSIVCSTPPVLSWPTRMAARARRAARGAVCLRTTVKMAVAAAIVAAVVGIWALSSQIDQPTEPSFTVLAQPAYATVLQEIDKTQSVRYTRTFQEEGRPLVAAQVTVQDGGLMRRVTAEGTVLIDNVLSGDGLTLYPRQKYAYKRGQTARRQQRYQNMVDWIRTLHEHKGVFSRQELLDGTLTNVYKVDGPYEKITIWANAWTHLPVRTETILLPCTDKDIRLPEMELRASEFTDDENEKRRLDHAPHGITHIGFTGEGVRRATTTVVLTDFAWDVDCDPSLFSLTPPKGYEVSEMADRRDAPIDESSLVKGLRFWAQTSAGRFPEDIGMLADCRPNLLCKYRPVGQPEEAFRQAALMLDAVLGGLTFAQELKVKDNWHYAGRDVVLGEAGKALCWWQLEDSRTFRVIYGDLRICDVAVPPEDPLPAAGLPASGS